MLNKALDLTGGKDTKLVGVTTDGESANTARQGGLRRLLTDQVQRGLVTFWCAGHRSDLAIESVVSTVPEFGKWKSNLLGLVRFFRTPRRMKMLSAQAGNVKQFPWHHDGRFAQHELQLVDAVLNNLTACIMLPPESTRDRKEKAEAKWFRKIWNHQRKWITSLMGEILEIFETLQKEQEDVIKDMKGLVMSRNMGSFVEHSVRVVRRLFPDEASDFADGAAKHWKNMMNVPFLPDDCDLGCKMTVRLRQLLPVTTGSVQKVLASLACTSPHFMETERIVNHHNLVVDNHRTSTCEDTHEKHPPHGGMIWTPPTLTLDPVSSNSWRRPEIGTFTGSVNSLGN